MDGFKYDAYNGVVKVDDQPGEDRVYLQPDERVLEIYRSGYEPLKLILSDYGIQLHSKEVWTIKIAGRAPAGNLLPVIIVTNPSDARITVDGKNAQSGKAIKLTKGQHRLLITKKGYRTINRAITVDEDHALFNFTLKEVDLVPVTINSNPVGAKIFLDGMEKGVTSKAMNLFPGSYQLKLTLNGYVPLEQTITVKENQKNDFQFTLTKNAGYLKLTIQPDDATLTINGKPYSFSKTIELLPGPYEITISKNGYLDINDKIDLKLGQTIRRSYRLEKNSGTLSLNVTPANATVLINKEDYSGKARIELAPGLYRIEIGADGYYPQSENITIVRGQILRKNYVLKQKTGKLNFAVSPAEAKVILKRNGRVVKTWQGANYLKNLPVGDYTMEISADGYAAQKKTITIAEQRLTNLDITLNKGLATGQTFTDNLGIEWVWVEGGFFEMGDTFGDGDGDEKPVHEVYVDGFYMSKYEVTNRQVVEVFNWALRQGKILVTKTTVKNARGNQQELLDLDDSDCQIGYDGNQLYVKGNYANYPVIEISWYGAIAFCNYLSELVGLTPVYDLSDWSCNWGANGIRLPTEAKWEYAARGGQKSRGYKYAGSNNVDEVAWYRGNSGRMTHPVGLKQPNELGLYDMSGNVWEWCWDWYDSDYYSKSPRNNPRGASGGSNRVRRGGSWFNYARNVRVANRHDVNPSYGNNFLGFRLLRTK